MQKKTHLLVRGREAPGLEAEGRPAAGVPSWAAPPPWPGPSGSGGPCFRNRLPYLQTPTILCKTWCPGLNRVSPQAHPGVLTSSPQNEAVCGGGSVHSDEGKTRSLGRPYEDRSEHGHVGTQGGDTVSASWREPRRHPDLRLPPRGLRVTVCCQPPSLPLARGGPRKPRRPAR